jgi:integrase
LAKRARYQYGNVELEKRVTGPDAWLYRWWETNSDGGRTRRALTIGSIEQYKTEAQALKAAESRRLMINDAAPSRPLVAFSALLDRFLIDQEQEVKAARSSALAPGRVVLTSQTEHEMFSAFPARLADVNGG